MTDMTRLQQQIADLIARVLQIEVAAPDADLLASGMFDSLAVVTLIAEVEDLVGFELPLDDFDIESFRTVERIAEFVGGCFSGQGAA